MMKPELVNYELLTKALKVDNYVMKVLDAIDYYGPCTRNDISRFTKLAVHTVDLALRKLEKAGAVYVFRYKVTNGYKQKMFSNRIRNVRIVYEQKPRPEL